MNNRVTYGASFNRTSQEDAAIIAWLEPLPSGKRSDAIRRALVAYIEQGNQPPPVTEQELAELRAELAWHRQNQDAAPVITADAVSTETVQAAPAGRELSEKFLNAVRAAAKPGIRLGD